MPGTNPSRCYWICATPRSGSSALCNALASTGVAGRPNEYLSPNNRERSLKHFQVQSYPDLLEAAKIGTQTENGVFGLKVMTGGYLEDLLKEVTALYRGQPLREALERAFPELHLVFLTRRNKVRQAVSHRRAIQSGQWHLTKNDAPVPPPLEAYRFEAIDTLVLDTVMREAAWQQFFERLDMQPIPVAYEAFAASPERVVRELVAALGLDLPPRWGLEPLPFRRIADEVSEAWVARYRRERQQAWEREIW